MRGLNEKLLSILSNAVDFRTRNIVSFQPYQPLASPNKLQQKAAHRQGAIKAPVVFLGTNVTLDVASANVREGDYICQFWNSNACVVPRKTKSCFGPKFEIIERAAIVSREEYLDWEVPGYKNDLLGVVCSARIS